MASNGSSGTNISQIIRDGRSHLGLSSSVEVGRTVYGIMERDPSAELPRLNDETTTPGSLDTRHRSISGPFDLKMESERRKTFRRWPVPFMDPDKLAEAGFYYLNKDDAVRCVFCGVNIGRWEEGDDAMKDHQRWGPQCPFIRKIPVGNVPLAGGLDLDPPQAYQAYDTCGLYGIDIHPFSGVEKTVLGDVSLEKLGVNKTQEPVFPQYASIGARFKSFDGWPLSLKQRPDKLSEAGFYYTGKGDQTVCFHCGGGLKDWEDEDDPWMEHALWFSKCAYVLLVKGRQFVEQVCAKRDPLMSGEQVLELETPASDTGTVLEGISTPSASTQDPESATSKEVKDSNMCKICFTEEMGVLFLPCGHIVACVKCASSLTTCAVCRQPFTATVRAYLS